MPDDESHISPEAGERLRQKLASLDGKTGKGGCDYCAAVYEFVTISLGESELRVYHEPDCTRQLQWLVQFDRKR